MRQIILLVLIFTSFLAYPQSVKVAAAANLRFVFDEIKSTYAQVNPKTNVSVIFGSSGALLQQILNGAEFDVFMAADNVFPVKLKEMGAASGEMNVYALGKLVLWSNTVDVSKGLDFLTDPSIKRIAVAKPELAPYGDRAIACLKQAGLFDKVKEKIIYADNISQTAQFAQTGNAELAFLALSLTLTPEMKGAVYIIDPTLYKPVEQAMILVKSRVTNPEASKFMKFVLSPRCKPIFEKYGYMVP